jgi:hypothetical protein
MTYLSTIASHLHQLEQAAAQLDTAMWPSVLDARTGRFPDGDHIPQRVYRLIGAPRGSTLYWDQPMIAAAYALSALTGSPHYAQAADRYIDEFLATCVAEDGLFLWGNHRYYDLCERRVVAFHQGHHELRPLTPAWERFWSRAPEQTAAYIRAMARRHIYDPDTGGFNRHDDGTKGHAFLEAGGVLVESLTWLYSKTKASDLLESALAVARYSYRHRDPATGLLPNEPDKGRWDAKVCTSEVGLWAQCLLRAHVHTSNDEFLTMAHQATRAYLEHAYDAEFGHFFGQVRLRDGRQVVPDEPGYWPGRYADPWNTDQWPTHDYPMPLADACLALHALTDDPIYPEAVRRWTGIIMDGRPARTGGWTYAENYGQCIHLLTRAGLAWDEDALLADARQLADEAIERLSEGDMIQGYPGGHVYEAVDGVGYLFLALMALETRGTLDMIDFRF